MMNSLGGRKVFVTLIIGAIGLGMVFYMGDIPPGLLALMQTVFGAFVAGNVLSHFASASVRKREVQGAAPNKDLETRLSQLEKISIENSSALLTIQKTITAVIDRLELNK